MKKEGAIVFGPYLIAVDDRWCPAGVLGHVWVKRADGQPAEPTFYEWQMIKCLAFGSHARAVEIFPAQNKLYDTGNFRHLWDLPSGVAAPCLVDGTWWAK